MTSTIVIHPIMPEDRLARGAHGRSPQACLEEAVGLAHAIDLPVVHSEAVRIHKIKPGTLFASGAMEHISALVAEHEAGLVIVDHALTPVQQRNMERAWKTKVIDRTGIILEIFGARARTKEGRLQVGLAALMYQRGRLVRAWTHLERQRGGHGFMGGPGETQIELDRRMLDERIGKIKEELEKVRKARNIQRRSRERVPYPVVALVGYTNAGKSTLFNRLTKSKVLAKDLLFATLDPTMRALELPSGDTAILSDTVGFISDLPTHLVAAFRATLEEVLQADIILHVRDISQPYSEAEKDDVNKVLTDLGIDPQHDPRIVEILNKIDLLDAETRDQLRSKASRSKTQIAASAVTGEGVEEILEKISGFLGRDRKTYKITLNITDGKALAWLYRHANIKERVDREDRISLKCEMEATRYERFKSQFAEK